MDDADESIAKKKARLDSVKTPKLERFSISQLKNVVLTSDARDFTEELKASQQSYQPSNKWYSKVKQYNGAVAGQEKASAQGEGACQINSEIPGADESDAGVFSLPTGSGTMAAILDSGINKSHMAFQGLSGKISPFSKSFVGDGDITDAVGHGTQCAGLFCGSSTPVLVHNTSDVMNFEGAAPGAEVMVCKVVEDSTRSANMEAVCEAIDYILNYNRSLQGRDKRVSVISLSFGATGFSHDLAQRIQDVLSENIIVVCAASNSGRKSKQPITYPARLGHVLCIGACNHSGKPASFTPVGREVDFLAPGEDLWAPTVGGKDCFCAVSGTSFATPTVAGVVCQVLEDLEVLGARTGEDRLVPLMSNVWCMRELLKNMATVQGRHCDEVGYGALEPMEYFLKTDDEKLRLVGQILHQ